MTRLDQALRIGALANTLSSLGDLVRARVEDTREAVPLILATPNLPQFNVTVPAIVAGDALAIIGKLLADLLDAELSDAANIHTEGPAADNIRS